MAPRLNEPQRLPAAEARLTPLAAYNCRANWYLGLVRRAREDVVGRDAAWSLLLTCSDRFTQYMSILLPRHQTLAVREQPLNPAAHFWLAGVYASDAPTAAVDHYRAGLRLEPDDGWRWLALGDLLANDDPVAAMGAYLAACEHGDPGGNGCWRAGQTAEALGDVRHAIDYFERSLAAKAISRAAQRRAGATPVPEGAK